jgi:hypothetical protein
MRSESHHEHSIHDVASESDSLPIRVILLDSPSGDARISPIVLGPPAISAFRIMWKAHHLDRRIVVV